MSFVSSIARMLRVGGPVRKREEVGINEIAEILASAAGERPDPFSESKNVGWSFAANRQIAGRASRVEPNLKRVTTFVEDDGSGKVESSTIRVHPLLDLLRKPNPDETGIGFRWRQILQMQQVGVCFVAVFPEEINVKGPGVDMDIKSPNIRQLRLLDPSRVEIEQSEDGSRVAGKYIYTGERGGRKEYMPAPVKKVERDQWRRDPYSFVFPVPFPDAENAIMGGGGPLAAGKIANESLVSLGKMHNNQLKNGVHSNLIFKLKSATEDPERFRLIIALLHQGIGKAGDPMFLPDERIEVDGTNMTNKDMQYSELSELSRQEILGVMGASDGVVGMVENSSRSTIWGQEHLLATGTIDPLNQLIAEAYNCWLLPLFAGQSDSSRLVLSFASSKLVDDKDVAEVGSTYVEAGIKTPNEVRDEIGISPHPDGNSLNKETKPGPNAAPSTGPSAGEEQQNASENQS